MIKIKNETGYTIELDDYTDKNGKSVFEPFETMEFDTWKDYKPREIIVYNDGDCKLYTSNSWADIYENEYFTVYI